MKKVTKYAIFALFGLSISISSCQKDPVMGPKGDKGDTGATGATGAQGNANVLSTSVFVAGSEWISNVEGAYVTKLQSNITTDILSKGIVMCYVSDGGSTYSALPTTKTGSSGVVLTIGFNIDVGKVVFTLSHNTGVALTPSQIGDATFKIVTVSGNFIKDHPKDYKKRAAELIDYR
jgi:hypothetical protein